MVDACIDVVVIGGGLGASQLVHTLRDKAFAGSIAVISREEDAPYHRPPLSKAYFEGASSADSLWIRDPTSYSAKNVELMLRTEAVAIDRHAQTVMLHDGRMIRYGKLVLATGARNRNLAGLDSNVLVYYLRTVADAAAIRSRAKDASSAVIVGGGFLGLEIAHVLRKAGKAVAVLEMAPRLLARTSSPAISDAVEKLHMASGVQVITGDSIGRICECAHELTILLKSGRKLNADLLIASIGVLPNVELAQEAGLQVENGIVVDEHLVTSDQRIFAIGDCARFPSPHSAVPLRLESVQNAIDQARCVAAAIVGDRTPYLSTPWFWSDLGVKLQIVGIVSSADEFYVKGDVASHSFSVYGFKSGRLVSVESLASPRDHMAARKLMDSAVPATVEDLGFLATRLAA